MTARYTIEETEAGVKAWKPETAAGRACKSAMLYWAAFPPVRTYDPLVPVLAMFGLKLGDAQPWPHCGPGNYGPVLVNALPRMVPLALPDYGRMADGSPVNVTLGCAAAPITRIFCE